MSAKPRYPNKEDYKAEVACAYPGCYRQPEAIPHKKLSSLTRFRNWDTNKLNIRYHSYLDPVGYMDGVTYD